MILRRPIRFFDTECYPNYWLIKFKDRDTGEKIGFELRDGVRLNIPTIKQIITQSTLIGFNSQQYDIPMITLALLGASNAELKNLNDALIKGGLKYWEFQKEFGYIDGLDHIDIIEVLPGVRISLKMYGARTHSQRLQDLPYSVDTHLTRPQQIVVSNYCDNDLDTTHDSYEAGIERVELREKLNAKYKIDVRSKSDAQIAEAIIKSKLTFTPQKQTIAHGSTFKYTAPAHIRFATPQLQRVLDMVQRLDFLVSDADQVRALASEEELETTDGEKIKTGVILPGELKTLRIEIGNTIYKPGIGGLHSQESKRFYKTIDGVQTIEDHDVTGYYPRLILSTGMYPAAIGPGFIPIYEEMVLTREHAKARVGVIKKRIAEIKKQLEIIG